MVPTGFPRKTKRLIRMRPWGQKSGKRATNRLIVTFRADPEASAEMLEQRCETLLEIIPEGKMIRPPSKSGRVVFSVDPNADLRRLAEEISRREDVEYAEPDIIDSAA